ncbi:hypothetical protein [Acinetobacter baumannii]|uniref:hypothetical protein n=1 Tax=Acinetobacter baumannii TaxID=470 RepID=UPI000DF256CF|nr:hypothetical protein [Acinetobacter baumannii]RCT89674.1 hypothetical protein DVA68_15860 [Acinetobacter baumannii]
MKLNFDFEHKQDSFFAGFIYTLIENTATCIFFLVVYALSYYVKYESIGLIFFALYAYCMISFAKYLVLLILSLVNTQKSFFPKFDFGSFFSLSLFLCVIIIVASNKFNIFPVSSKSIGIIFIATIFAIVSFVEPLLSPERLGYSKINFTSDRAKVEDNTFFIEKNKLNKVRILTFMLPLALGLISLQIFIQKTM